MGKESPPLTSKILSNAELSLFEKNRALEAMLNFVEQVNGLDSIEDVVWHLAQHTIKALNFEDCVIYLLSRDGNTLVQTAAFGPKSPTRKKIVNPIKLKIGQGIVGQAAKNMAPIRIADTSEEENYIVDDNKRLSELAVPIVHRHKLLGVIDSEHSFANFFTYDHQRYVEILASVLAAKITFEKTTNQLTESISALEQSRRLTNIYFRISEVSHEAQSEDDFYRQLHEVIENEIKAQSFYVALLDLETGLYKFPYLYDEKSSSRINIDLRQKELSHSLVAEVIEKQKIHLAKEQELKTYSEKNRLLNKSKIPISWIAVPFKISESLHGAIALQSYDESIIFGQQDKVLLSFLSQHLSNAIDRQIKDQKLQHQALHDPVTKLGNRTLFIDRLEHAYNRCKRSTSKYLALLFIDFDNFKMINDKFGHHVGDQLLLTAAKRMQTQLRDSDTLARVGGDEFAILIEDITDRALATTIGHRILESMRKSISADGQTVYATISIGIAYSDEHCSLPEDLLKNADQAMYYAKSIGKNSMRIYESTLHQAVVYERQIIRELEIGLAKKQLIFHYQPIVDLSTNKILGFEALMRWQHPEKGLIAPGEFIHIAEQNQIIKLIDSQLLMSVAETLNNWQRISKQPLYVSVNISAQRFVDSHLIDEIKSVMNQYQLLPGSLVIEVTEHILMDNISKARLLFHQLHQLGVRLSLDDFGTGYSSLGYLNQLPFDTLKIDRSFVSQINDSRQNHPIIKTIIALAEALEISLVAEGIETISQLKALKRLNCGVGQGFYLSRPVSAEKAQELVLKGKV